MIHIPSHPCIHDPQLLQCSSMPLRDLFAVGACTRMSQDLCLPHPTPRDSKSYVVSSAPWSNISVQTGLYSQSRPHVHSSVPTAYNASSMFTNRMQSSRLAPPFSKSSVYVRGPVESWSQSHANKIRPTETLITILSSTI